MFFLNFIIISLVYGFKDDIDNKYLILSTSKFWFNVRQSVNVLMIYQSLKDMGVSDDNIILLIPENSACNSKNNKPGIVCPYDDQDYPNIYRNLEIDYKSNDVRISSWINILRGKYNRYTPQSRRLKLNKFSKFVSYATGHGGDGYMKMQATNYLLDFEMAMIVREMEHLGVFQQAFFIADSCGAITLYEQIQTTNVLCLGSSSYGEKSYSYGRDNQLGLSKSDIFTMTNYKFLNNQFKINQHVTLEDLFKHYDPIVLKGHYKFINNLPNKPSDNESILDLDKTY